MKFLNNVFSDLASIIFWATVATLVGLLLGTLTAKAEVRIAVIDSGINYMPQNFKLCKGGHRDFTGTGMEDRLNHGTSMVDIISRYLPDEGYCIVIIKVFDPKAPPVSYIKGLKYASELEVQFVNMSLTGKVRHNLEQFYVKKILLQGKKIVAAAGNEGLDFDKVGCVIYPACYYDEIIIVGDEDRKFNRGKYVDFYDNGAIQFAGGVLSQGTSLATAHVTGKLVKNFLVLSK